MARSLNDIQQSIIEAKNTATELDTLQVLTANEKVDLADSLSTTSRVSIWRLFVWIVAFGIYIHEQLMDVLKADLEKRITATRPFTKQWYISTALNYQHGYDLPETGVYPTPESATDIQAVNASKVIKQAAVVQQIINGVGALRLKVATLTAGNLAPVNNIQLAGLQAYMELMGAAGVYVIATTGVADDLKLVVDVYYNPLILDNNGKRLDGTNDAPLQTAVNDYLKSSTFNGVLDLNRLTNVMEAVNGVESPFITIAASKYGNFDYDTVGVTNVGVFDKFRQPDSGYFQLDEVATTFNFIESNV